MSWTDDKQQLRFGNNPFVDVKKAQYVFRTVCITDRRMEEDGGKLTE